MARQSSTVLNVFTITEEDIIFVNEVDIMKELNLFAKENPDKFEKFISEDHWVYEKDFDMSYEITNDFDIVVQINKPESEMDRPGEENSVYFYISGKQILKRTASATLAVAAKDASNTKGSSLTMLGKVGNMLSREEEECTHNLLYSAALNHNKFTTGFGWIVFYTENDIQIYSLNGSL